ncbi:MAG: hypothetical protein IJP44_01385 [Bacteroidales bacterium]|nr:hypothetical protein [Bacteroidales bacterium]
MSNRLRILLFLFQVLLLSACRTNFNYQEMMETMGKINQLEKTYIIEAEYVSKEELEYRVKEKFGGEEVKIGAVGNAKYNEEKNCFENGKCWLKTAILNPQSFSELDDLERIKSTGLEIAKETIKGISNLESYDRIEISFILNDKHGNLQYMKTNSVFFSLPDLSKVSFNYDFPDN